MRRLGKQNAGICCYHNPLWVRPVWPYTPSTGIVMLAMTTMTSFQLIRNDVQESCKINTTLHQGNIFLQCSASQHEDSHRRMSERNILGKVQMLEFHVIRWHQCSVSLDSGITTWSQFNKNYTRVLAGIFSKLKQTPGNELDDTLTSQKTRLTSVVTSTTLRCQHVSLQLFTLSNPRNWNR